MNVTNVRTWLTQWRAAGGGWVWPRDGEPQLLRPIPRADDQPCDEEAIERLRSEIAAPHMRAAVIGYLATQVTYAD